MASRGFAVTLLAGGALAHPAALQCGDERFTVGSTTKCMTLDIEDQQEHPGLRFMALAPSKVSDKVRLTVAVESPGPYDNSTGQDPFGIYFAILANTMDSTDYGSFTEMPESVAPKDNTTCPHMVYSGADDTFKDRVALTWTAGPKTCGDVTFTMLWGNGPGDPPKAPEAPFLYRTVLKVSGKACGVLV